MEKASEGASEGGFGGMQEAPVPLSRQSSSFLVHVTSGRRHWRQRLGRSGQSRPRRGGKAAGCSETDGRRRTGAGREIQGTGQRGLQGFGNEGVCQAGQGAPIEPARQGGDHESGTGASRRIAAVSWGRRRRRQRIAVVNRDRRQSVLMPLLTGGGGRRSLPRSMLPPFPSSSSSHAGARHLRACSGSSP